MIIYNVLINDRHCDLIIHNFREFVPAINFARQKAREFCKFPGELNETHFNPNDDDGWILHIETSSEGDYVRVTEGELK